MADLASVPVSEKDYSDFKHDEEKNDLDLWAQHTAEGDELHEWASGVAQEDQQREEAARVQADASKAAQMAAGKTYDAFKPDDDLTAWVQKVTVGDDAVSRAFGDLGPDVVANMRKIRQLESGGNDQAVKSDEIEDSHGAFQINARAHPDLAQKYDLHDPEQNARAAREVYDSQGYRAWLNSSRSLGLLDGGPAPDQQRGTDVPGGSDRTGKVTDADRVEALDQFGVGLPDDQAYSVCGPVAALAFAQQNGRNPTLAEAQELARQVGWTAQGGMNGVANEKRLLDAMGVASRLDTDPDFGRIAQDADSGNPVIVSTAKHYYYVNGYDKATGKLHVGKTGTARIGGAEWMSAQEIANLDGGINGALFVDNPNSPTPSVGANDDDAYDTGTLEDAGKGAVDQATGSTPDVPPLYFGGGPVPYVPSKPTQTPQDATDKMLGGQPLDGQDFLSATTKATGNQGTAQLMSEDGPSPQISVPSITPPPKSKVHALLDQLGDVLTGMATGGAEAIGGAAKAAGGFVENRVNEAADELRRSDELNRRAFENPTNENVTAAVEANSPYALAMTGQINQAERAAMPAVDKILRQWDAPKQATGSAIAQKLEDARTFLVRKLTDRRVDLNQVQQDVQRLYGSLPEDMQVSELSRLNPSGAATLRVQNDLAPAIREAGDDLPYVNSLLAARGNVDVAVETGRKAEQAFLEQAKPPELTDIGPKNAAMVRSGVNERARTQPDVGPNDPARAASIRQEAEMLRKFSGGLDVAESQAAVDQLQATLGPERFQKVSAVADKVAQVNRDLRQQLVDSGRITQETADEWARAYPNYTPVQIVDYLAEQAGVPMSGQGKSLGVRGGGIQALSQEGTERARLSPIASTVNNVYTVESLAKQNATVNALRNWVERVPEMAQRFQVVDGVYSGTRAENAVSGWRNGERFSVVTPFADMAKVLKQEPTQTIPLIGPVMQAFKELITARNPAFLVRNALMDFPTYLVRETAQAGGMPADTARAIGRYVAAIPDAFSGLLSGEMKGAATQRYLAGGGSMESWAQKVRSPRDAERYVEELRRTGGIHISNAGDLAHIAKAILSGDAFKVVGERVELVPRVAAFRGAEQAGLSPAQAVARGRSVTVDFAEGGTWVKTLNQAIPFLNPAVQGGANLARTIYQNPKGAGMTFALGLSAPTLAIEAWNESDPERSKAYADVPDYVKDRGWVVMLPGPGGKGVLTATDEKGNPTPQYLALNLREFAPVVDATRAAGRTAFGAETRSWGDLLRGALGQVIPTAGIGDLTPIGAKTAVELSVDQDFYRGTHIATKNADERASILSKALADGYNDVAARFDRYPNVRPSQVEYAGRENLGVLAQVASGASDLVTGKKAGSTNPQDVPVVGSFIRGNLGNATGQQLEDAREERLDPDVKRALHEMGLIADVTAVPSDVHNVPLLRAEQADYQRRANGHVNEMLRNVLADPAFSGLPADIKKRVVQNVVQGAKAAAAGETLAGIGEGQVRARLATAKKAS